MGWSTGELKKFGKRDENVYRVAAPEWGDGREGFDGGPGGGSFCCHLVPFVKTPGLGVLAGCVVLAWVESWWASFLSILAASWVFLFSMLSFVLSIICLWVVTWGREMGGRGREGG